MSLRLRVLLLVTLVNVAVFTAGLWFLSSRLAGEREALQLEFAERLDYTLRPTIDPDGELKVAQILQWPYWKDFEDAIIIDRNLSVAADGRITPRAVFLNPTGSLRRQHSLDVQAILRLMARAMEASQPVGGAQGLSVPIYDLGGRTWGALWFRLDTSVDRGPLIVGLAPWFLASTILLTLGTFLMLRRFVLHPVEQLAEGARRVRSGALDTRLVVPGRRDELADLMRSFNDMTAQVQSFNERLEREVGLATAQVRAIEAAAMRQRQLAAMGELAAGIAHEINNPLGGMLNAVQVLERDDLERSRRARYLALLTDGLERVQATVGKLLRFTPRETLRAPLDLSEAARASVSLVEHRAVQRGVRLEFEAQPGLPQVLGDRTELGQAVLNLVGNALDALESAPPPGGGRVRVLLERAGDRVSLTVEDNGPGVGPQVLERLGDLFYTTKEVGKGTGLGLALVQSIVLQHGGRVEFSSRVGAGLKARILLPGLPEAAP
jgi:signal transduction histidine kinase